MCGKILKIVGGETYCFDDICFSESLCELTLTLTLETLLGSFNSNKARQLVGEKAQIRYQGYELLVTIGFVKLISSSSGMTVKYCIDNFENLHVYQGSGRFYFYIPCIKSEHTEGEFRSDGSEGCLSKTSFQFNGRQWILHDAYSANYTTEEVLPFSDSEVDYPLKTGLLLSVAFDLVDDYEVLSVDATRICTLMSLALGRFVTWVYSRIRVCTGRYIYRNSNTRVVNAYVKYPPIIKDLLGCAIVAKFVESVGNEYLRIISNEENEEWINHNIYSFVHHLPATMAIRSLGLCVVAESIATKFAQMRKSKRRVKRMSYCEKLEYLCKEGGVESHIQEKLAPVFKTRNLLAHEGRLDVGDTDRMDYFYAITSAVTAVILALLGYDGDFSVIGKSCSVKDFFLKSEKLIFSKIQKEKQ